MSNPKTCRLCQNWHYRGLRHGVGVGLCSTTNAETSYDHICDADPNKDRMTPEDISKLMPNDVTNLLQDTKSEDMPEFFNSEIAAMLRVYGWIGHPCRCGDMCYVPKTLLMEAARRIHNAPLCKNRECEPPTGGKEHCEFYEHGFCRAHDVNTALTLDDLKSMVGKYVYWDTHIMMQSGECLIQAGHCITSTGYTFSLQYMLDNGKVYRKKPAGLSENNTED